MFDCNSPLISIFCLPSVRHDGWYFYIFDVQFGNKASQGNFLLAFKTLATNDEPSEEPVIDHSNNVEKKKF